MADTLERKIENAIDQNSVIDDLGQGFKNSPSGEFLLSGRNKNLRTALLIYNIDILPDKAVFSAGVAFREPKSNKLIAFRADNIAFSYYSGLAGPVRLCMLDSVAIQLGKAVDIVLNGGDKGGNYVLFDCDGIKQFGIKGSAEFASDIIQPVSENIADTSGQQVRVDFETVVKSWDDLILSVSLPDFAFKGLPQFVFKVQNAVLDLSESSNAGDMDLPGVYKKQMVYEDCETLWEGFFLNRLEVTLPAWAERGDKERISFGVSHAFIDEFGFTGDIFATRILPFEKGNLGGWSFSISEISATVELNRCTGLRITGDMGMPALHDTSRLHYVARTDYLNNYLFTIGTKGTFTFPALRACDVRLDRNSYITAKVDGSSIHLTANLNGRFDLKTAAQGEESTKFSFPEVQFSGLNISNKGDKFGIDYLGINGRKDSATFSKFPIQFESLAFVNGKENQYIQADFRVNFTEYASASAGVKVYCKMRTENGRERLRFVGFGLSSVAVAFEKSGIAIQGQLDVFKEDLSYGNGFSGSLTFCLRDPEIRSNARAIFGSVNGIRYWYFDAEVSWKSPGLPIGPGLNMSGFSGGAWHRLKPWNGKDKLLHPELGTTSSGTIYVPDVAAGMGFKAGVFLRGSGERSYAAKVILEMQFMKNGGLDRILFYGDVEIMPETDTDSKGPGVVLSSVPPSGSAWDNYSKMYKPKAQICGPFMLVLDFKNRAYSANAAIFIKEAAGNTINGSYKNDKAGEINIFFSRSKWFVRVGTPLQPLSVAVKVATENSILAKVYFMAGHDILPAPPPPSEVSQALGSQLKLDAFRNLEAMSSGKGFAYGAAIQMGASASGSDKRIGVYAGLRATVAMDVNLLYYGNNTYCSNSGKPLGIMGWYARGNLYTFFQGKLGAKVREFKFDIMTLTGAMALSLSAPNPFYASGVAQLEFRLSSVLKFKGSVNIEIGEPCELRQQPGMDSSLIYAVSPEENSIHVSTLGDLHIDFSTPVNRSFQSIDGKNYMFRVRKLELVCNGINEPGSWVWSDDGLRCTFSRSWPLKGHSTYQLQCEIDLVNSRDLTQTKDSKGNVMEEMRSFSFTTDESATNIPLTNIAHSYPFPGQVNFYRRQTQKAHLQLKIPQNELVGKAEKKTIARFSSNTGSEKTEVWATYSEGRIEYEIPDLRANAIYKLRIVSVHKDYILNNGKNTSGINSNQIPGSQQSNPGKHNVSQPQSDILLLEFWFRTSHYGSFAEKMKAMQVKGSKSGAGGNVLIKLENSTGEYLEPAEVNGGNVKLNVSADLYGSVWYSRECRNKVYSIFPVFTWSELIHRDTLAYGATPTRAVEITQSGLTDVRLTPEHIFQGKSIAFANSGVTVAYLVPSIVGEDLEEIKQSLLVLNGNTHNTKQGAINKYVGLFGNVTPTSSSGGNSDRASSQSQKSNSVAHRSSQSSSNTGAGNSRHIASKESIQKLKLSTPPAKSVLPILWNYSITDNLNTNYQFSQNLQIQ